ncbi:hypothetical protein CJI97_000828 [Candidozyma auris]|nr:hypothetical protein CJI97_000828 [[Candida] auris]
MGDNNDNDNDNDNEQGNEDDDDDEDGGEDDDGEGEDGDDADDEYEKGRNDEKSMQVARPGSWRRRKQRIEMRSRAKKMAKEVDQVQKLGCCLGSGVQKDTSSESSTADYKSIRQKAREGVKKATYFDISPMVLAPTQTSVMRLSCSKDPSGC